MTNAIPAIKINKDQRRQREQKAKVSGKSSARTACGAIAQGASACPSSSASVGAASQADGWSLVAASSLRARAAVDIMLLSATDHAGLAKCLGRCAGSSTELGAT